jgi:uncharacterized membrane protein YphA (DoxX/SURF4 family)
MSTFKQKAGSYWKRAEPVLLHRYFVLFSRIVLGGIFIFAGQAKMFPIENVDTLIWEINQYNILPHQLATAYGWVLPPLEILIGILLISGIFLKTTSVLSGLITLSFIIAKAEAMIRGLDISICGCFGSAVPLLKEQSLAIDFVMLAMSVQIFFRREKFLEFGSWVKGVADRSKAKDS